MIGKKAFILTLLVILVVQVVFPIQPVLAKEPQPLPSDACGKGINLGDFIWSSARILSTWTALAVLNSATSSLAGLEFEFSPTILGFSLGSVTSKDIFEPIDETMDKIYGYWVAAIFFGTVGSVAAVVSSYLVRVALDMNANLLTDNPIIGFGHGTILGLVNLGFVIAIIVIAFATMFRRSSWNAQSSLAKLIIAALLINFSLFFAGTILNISTNLTAAILKGRCVSEDLLSSLNITTIETNINKALSPASPLNLEKPSFNPDDFKDTEKSKDTDKTGTFIINLVLWPFKKFIVNIIALFFASGLTIIGALTIFGIFLFLTIRYVAVIILLIFMPIIWLGLVFPKLQVPGVGNAWSGWWKEYLKWMIFGPILAFFLVLSIKLMNEIPNLVTDNAFQGIVQILVVIIFSLSGLYAANKMGVAGASMMYGSVAKLGTKGLANLKSTGLHLATAPLRTEAGKRIMGGLVKGKLLGIPTGTKEIGRLGMQAEAYARKQSEAGAKKYTDLTPEQQNQVREGMSTSSLEYAAMTRDLLKKGKLKDNGQLINKKVKAGLERSGNGNLYKELQVFTGSTVESLEALARGDVEGASKIVFENVLKNVKDFSKVGFEGLYEDIDRSKYKDGASYAKAVEENRKKMVVVSQALFRHSPEALKAANKGVKTKAQRDNLEKNLNDVWGSSGVGKEARVVEEAEKIMKGQVEGMKVRAEIEMAQAGNDGNKKADIQEGLNAKRKSLRRDHEKNLEKIKEEREKTYTEFDKSVSERTKEFYPTVRKIIHSGQGRDGEKEKIEEENEKVEKI